MSNKYQPSRVRRDARSKYHPGLDPADFNPYLKRIAAATPQFRWFWEGRSNDWLKGWQQAEREYVPPPED